MSTEHPLLVSLHHALRSANMSDNDVHFVLDWIEKDLDEMKFKALVLSGVMLVLGVILGILVERFL